MFLLTIRNRCFFRGGDLLSNAKAFFILCLCVGPVSLWGRQVNKWVNGVVSSLWLRAEREVCELKRNRNLVWSFLCVSGQVYASFFRRPRLLLPGPGCPAHVARPLLAGPVSRPVVRPQQPARLQPVSARPVSAPRKSCRARFYGKDLRPGRRFPYPHDDPNKALEKPCRLRRF